MTSLRLERENLSISMNLQELIALDKAIVALQRKAEQEILPLKIQRDKKLLEAEKEILVELCHE